MSPPPSPDLEALLAHAGWIRSLARSLVADRNRADDLVQQTFVAALEHPPGPSMPIRRWLGAVVRNFARQDHRGERRRAEREAASAHPEATASAHDTVEAVAVQRALFDAVLALDEPYRSSILQRYYEGLPPREIAKRQRVPVKTVKTRLARGLEKLRADLDRGHGGNRQAWLPALLPLAGWPGIPASTLGTLLVNTKIKIACGAVALAGAFAVVWSIAPIPARAPKPPLEAARPQPDLERPDVSASLAASRQAPGRESVAEIPVATVTTCPAGGIKSITIARGRVIDVEGRAVPGIPIVLHPHQQGRPLTALREAEAGTGAPAAISLADGTFEISTTWSGGTLLARSPQLTTVFASDIWGRQSYDNLLIVVAPRGGIGGVVVDADENPIAKATVEIQVLRSILGDLVGIADQTFEIPWRATTDERGRFEIADAPTMEGAMLTAAAPGWMAKSEPVPGKPTFDVRIVLGRTENPIARGEVVDARGFPVPGAMVSCNMASTRTDEQGRFSIDPERIKFTIPMPGPRDELVALKEGSLPARFAKPPEGWPAFVTLRLEGEPLTIRGRIVDEAGAGVLGAQVWVIDEHDFGVVMEEVGNSGRRQSIESLLRGGLETVPSGRDGAFVLAGLVPGDYRVACMQEKTLLSAQLERVPAGTQDVRLVLHGADRCSRAAGRVVSRAGKPVQGVTIHPGRKLARWPYGEDPPFPMFGDSATTDAEGRFAFERLSPEGLSFQLLSSSLVVTFWVPPAEARLGELEIVVALRCHLQVNLGDREGFASSYVVLDQDDKPIEALEYRGPIVMVQNPVPIEMGLSPVVAVTEDARTIVLSKDGQEVTRIPVTLLPGELKVVRP